MSNHASIIELIKERLESGATTVPVFHMVALRLQQLLVRPDFSTQEVSRLISADAGLASKVLRAGNASFYLGLNKVNTIPEAIMRLGSAEVANIVTLTIQQDLYRSREPRFNAIMQSLWKHSFCTAVASRWLAHKAGFSSLAQEAFLGGLLHDIGKLFLLKVMEEIGEHEELRPGSTEGILNEIFDILHVEQGHQLMRSWLMPETYCEVVRYHDGDDWDRDNRLLAIVRLANLGCRMLGVGLRWDPSLLLYSSAEAHLLGLNEIALAELEIVVEDAVKLPSPLAAQGPKAPPGSARSFAGSGRYAPQMGPETAAWG